MLELYLNTTTRTFYDADGDPFRDNNPQGAFQSRETIKIYLCTETPEAGEEAANPQSWTRDTYFGTIEGISAKLTCDNDYIHKLKGTLTGELPSGSVSSITATISGATLGKIPEFGTVRLYSPNGNYEAVAYSERSLSGETATFTVSTTIKNSYSTGATIDCDQSPYCESYVDAEQSDIANGELVFELAYDSVRLREEMQYTDTEKLQVKGLELLFYKTNSDATQEKIKRFLCETFIITGTLGNIGYESEPPEPVVNMIESSVLTAVNENKPEIDSESGNWFVGQTDTGIHATMELSIGTVSSGESPSATITGEYPNKTLNLVLEKGERGEAFKFDATGTLSELSNYDAELKDFAFLATDTGNIYIKISDTSGDWSDPIPFKGDKGDDGLTPEIDPVSKNWLLGEYDTGVKAEGKDGTNGKSAYELWKDEPGNSDKTLDDFFNAYRGNDGTGLTVRGEYEPLSTYQKTESATDAVQYNGSLWGYINATAGSGNAPPETSATTSNDYWTLLVGKGDKGENGKGIVSIEKTSTQGTIDTYTITYTDETTSTFTVTNGKDGQDGLTPSIDPDTKHWMIGEEDTGVLAEAKLEGGISTFSNVSENIATLATSNIPVGVRTNKGNYYPVEKGSIVINVSGGTVQIDVSPYLAYDNSASFSGTWTVYFAAGKQGEKGNNALSFQIGTVTTLPAGSDATVTATVNDEGLVTLNLGIPQGPIGTLSAVISSTTPENPSEGLIWIED